MSRLFDHEERKFERDNFFKKDFKPSCETCFFFRKQKRDEVCIRNPPQVVSTAKHLVDNLWPRVYPNQWCGEYSYSPEEEEKP